MRRERAALVVEGYTDVLMLYQSGIKNAVATLGTATTPGHLRTLTARGQDLASSNPPAGRRDQRAAGRRMT